MSNLFITLWLQSKFSITFLSFALKNGNKMPQNKKKKLGFYIFELIRHFKRRK